MNKISYNFKPVEGVTQIVATQILTCNLLRGVYFHLVSYIPIVWTTLTLEVQVVDHIDPCRTGG